MPDDYKAQFRKVSVKGDASPGLKNPSDLNAAPPSCSVRSGSGIIIVRYDAIGFSSILFALMLGSSQEIGFGDAGAAIAIGAGLDSKRAC